MGAWSRASPVTKMEYYKMALKSTSATKSVVAIDPQIPQELSDVREANEHFVRMRLEAGCRIPRPQVICVRDVYPEKNILPRCTLLHRCTEMTGCCEDESTQCSPKAMQEVVMLFYVLGGDHRSTNVEKLLFVNHTECECQTKPNITTTVAPTTPLPTTTTTTLPTTTTSTSKTTEEQFPLGDQKYNKCRSCPSPFHSRELEDGICSCDCFDRHKPCIRIKRGREALSDGERRCVLAGHCHIPECDYGSYDPDRGRCPKRPDYDGFKGNDGKRPTPNHKNPNHRWTYFERD
nr:uncharacterized protein LOC107453542 [Parasteatoda tepidariorum]